ncbi:hypothetical protein B0T19DRAFT_446590 [Cercophora scortea]|uniref:2EXR domain-containing protein n=1 Tax=Cercophora scortea TaxID=314031 RepID=A0AAE0I3D5_9PEZI|nr:hypothetical protein B0T19DRAFT_446590 [Cercophora scortea]
MSSDKRSPRKPKLSSKAPSISDMTMGHTKTFHRFPDLALELQIIIWEEFMCDYKDNPGVVWQLVWGIDESAPTDLSRQDPNKHLNVRPYIRIDGFPAPEDRLEKSYDDSELLKVSSNPLLKVCRESRRVALHGHRYVSLPVLNAHINIIVRPREDVFWVVEPSIGSLIAEWEAEYGRLVEVTMTEDMGFVKQVLMSNNDVAAVMLENSVHWDYDDSGNGVPSWHISRDYLRTVERIFADQCVWNFWRAPSGRRFWNSYSDYEDYRRSNPNSMMFRDMIDRITELLFMSTDPRIRSDLHSMRMDREGAIAALGESQTLKWALADGAMAPNGTDGLDEADGPTVGDPCKHLRAYDVKDTTPQPFKKIFRDTSGPRRKRRDRARHRDSPVESDDSDLDDGSGLAQSDDDSECWHSDVSDSDLDGQSEDLSDTNWRMEEDDFPIEGGESQSSTPGDTNGEHESVFGNSDNTDKRHLFGMTESKPDQATNHSRDSRTGEKFPVKARRDTQHTSCPVVIQQTDPNSFAWDWKDSRVPGHLKEWVNSGNEYPDLTQSGVFTWDDQCMEAVQ